MSKTNLNDQRTKLLENVSSLSDSYKESMEALKKLSWDYEGDPFTLHENHLSDALNRYLKGSLSQEQVYEWADFMEVREDIRYPDNKEKIFSDIMFDLSTPDIQGALTRAKALDFLYRINNK